MNVRQQRFVASFRQPLTLQGRVRQQMALLHRRFYYPACGNSNYDQLCRATENLNVADLHHLDDNPEAQRVLLLQLRLEGKI